MKTTRGERLRTARIAAGFRSARAAAQALDVAVSTYGAHEKAEQPGARDYGPDEARRYARRFRVTPEFLLTGLGELNAERGHLDSSDVDARPLDQADRPKAGIPEIDIRAGMGGGGFAESEVRFDGNHSDPVKPETWQFPTAFVREELRAPVNRLIIIETQGDSMSPTIEPGERLVIDTAHTRPSPDGIYALRDQFDAVVVKRLQILRGEDRGRVRVISDNAAHSAETVGLGDIAIVGRVICGLKRY